MAFPQVVALLITKLPEVWGLAAYEKHLGVCEAPDSSP